MAGRAVRTTTAEINPMFYIPEGVEELKYGDDLLVDTTFGDDTAETAFDDSDDSVFEDDTNVSAVGEDDTDYTDAPATPQVLGIFSQTIRTTATGGEVVDVVFSVEDIAGVSNYEIRVVKI